MTMTISLTASEHINREIRWLRRRLWVRRVWRALLRGLRLVERP